MLKFTINERECTRCGQCVADCPTRIIAQENKGIPHISPDQESLCLQCQHCLAICPAGAISIFGRNPDNSLPLSAAVLPTFDQMTRLIRGRRSTRQFKDENIDPALIQKMLATLANSPTGCNARELCFAVIDDKAVLHRLREKVLTGLSTAATADRKPDYYEYLKNAVSAYREHGADIIFRGAPHALIISAPPDAPCPQQDVALALAYFELLAQSAGLGTVWWGMLAMTLETLPELKPLLGLPADWVYYAILFGTPSIRFARTVQRDDAARISRISIV